MTDPKHPDQNPSKAPQDSIEDDWASAMAEQGQGDDVSDDPWADALAEQVASEATPPLAPGRDFQRPGRIRQRPGLQAAGQGAEQWLHA